METSGYTTSYGGLGRTTDDMTYPYGNNTFTGWYFPTTWADDVTGELNAGYPYLAQVYPNPCSWDGSVTFVTKAFTHETSTLTIYNLKGQKVSSFEINAVHPSVIWNGRDAENEKCGAGIYLYKYSSNKRSETQKLIILK